jgi:hypothetical protein
VTDERIPIGGTPGFATLNVRCGRSFGDCDQHRLSLSLENITDRQFLENHRERGTATDSSPQKRRASITVALRILLMPAPHLPSDSATSVR